MAQSHPECDWIYQCDDIVIDPRAHRLERGGMAISVEPKAYAVLMVLLQQAGEVVGKDALLDAAWGHRHVTPGVLTRVISQLRHALGDCAAQPHYIATVHSLGYRFIGDVHRVPSAYSPERLPDTASNDDLAPAPEIVVLAAQKPAHEPVRPRHWLAAAITLAVIVAVLAVFSFWRTPDDHATEPRVTPQPAIALMPVARELDTRPMHPRHLPHYRRLATEYPGDRDDAATELRAAGFLTLRPEQAPAARG
ncbi:winged helix-turn-helix domain-containing protein [Dyella sp. C11]|uniref:winged helix-turn-helix domain-containing protein n=1 Tax=Dyella sp. C11 TaxID=2126991 RepID=UPI000D64355D|nr:winged helix-turn-helix domain-containing protein [Dyella sp. C11]